MDRVIEIGVPVEELAARERRVAQARRFEVPDRVPVWPAINYRYLLPAIGVPFRDYFQDPETMLRSQILGQKWLMEHIRTDQYSITGAWVGGMDRFPEHHRGLGPWAARSSFRTTISPGWCPGWVSTDADLRRLERIDVVESGLNGRQVAFRRAMMAVAEKYPVRFQGGPVFYPGANPALTHTSHGPFAVAADLMGQTEMFAAILERPDFVRELLDIVTDKIIAWLDFCWEEMQIPHRNFAWTDDLAAYLSAQGLSGRGAAVREEAAFPLRRLGSACTCAGTPTTCCASSSTTCKINELQGFGWEVDLDRIGEIMGGRVVLLGNVSPLTIANGTPDQVKAATRRVIEKLGAVRRADHPGRQQHRPRLAGREHQRDDGGGRGVRALQM